MIALTALVRASLLGALMNAAHARTLAVCPALGDLDYRDPVVTAWLALHAETRAVGDRLWTAALIARREAESDADRARERAERAEMRALEEAEVLS